MGLDVRKVLISHRSKVFGSGSQDEKLRRAFVMFSKACRECRISALVSSLCIVAVHLLLTPLHIVDFPELRKQRAIFLREALL